MDRRAGRSRVPLQLVRVARVCGTLCEFSGSFHSFSEECLRGTGNFTGEGDDMKSDKNLKACIDVLKSLQSRDGIEPEQKEAVARALEKLMELRRHPNIKRQTVFLAVREITEAIIKTFLK